MSDLSFVAGEFPGLASTSREAAEAVRSARPEGGGSAFASAMPGTPLSSDMQGAEEKIADRSMDNAKDLDQAADSLESSERDFIAAEEENGQLIGSIMSEQGGASTATGHSYGRATVGSGGDDVSFGSPGVGHSYGKGGSAGDDVSFGSPGVGHSYGKGDSADGSRLYDAPGTSDGRILRPGVPAGRETLEDPNDFWVGPYGGRGGVEAKPYTGGAKVEAKPFSEELGGVVNL
ncbi:hypothetical protein ND910_04735 [Schaalia meyeri]|uniref:hypothetical protein n=1 Tax=Schaalia meyeri TaxID=52773 RepID=UPI002043E840|nr:hypothetical protein [Schaalia meyeri]MCM3899017.1 hypothetical protein [Schaalia meyeri]